MNGRAVAHYRITAKPGQGGMGEAPHITDTKLRREGYQDSAAALVAGAGRITKRQSAWPYKVPLLRGAL